MYASSCTQTHTNTHTHTDRDKESERERERAMPVIDVHREEGPPLPHEHAAGHPREPHVAQSEVG